MRSSSVGTVLGTVCGIIAAVVIYVNFAELHSDTIIDLLNDLGGIFGGDKALGLAILSLMPLVTALITGSIIFLIVRLIKKSFE